MRPIDADRLLKTIANLDVECVDQKQASIMLNTIQKVFPQIVNDEPTIKAEPVNGWISVTDEMPKLGQRVMAFCRAGILTFLRYDGEVWFEMSSRNEYLLSFVTHWQHLPEPPKGE